MVVPKLTLPSFFNPKDDEGRDEKERLHKKYTDLVSTFPQFSLLGSVLRQYHGYWFPEDFLPLILAAQDHFQAQPSDLLLASYPKSGTTWLKALVFSIVRRTRYSPVNNQQDHPLFGKNPHELVGSLETQVPADPDPLAYPRIFHSHSPFCLLPESVKENAKIVYVCREPKDTLVSMYHFAVSMDKQTAKSAIEGMVAMFCSGMCPWGPIWDQMLEFWNESKRSPDKVLFLKYDEMKSDTVDCVKRLADFVGFPFSEDEEKEGVVQGIIELCSFENLSNLDVNISGTLTTDIYPTEKSSFFRLGKTGDWKNNITEEMAQRLDDVIQQKLEGSGLSF